MAAHSFTAENVAAAIDYVAREGAQDRAATRSYSLVFAKAGLPPPQLLHQGQEPQIVTDFMKAFHDQCIAQGLPPLDALVVHVAGPRKDWPGGGYFKVNGYADPLAVRTRPEDAASAARFWQEQKAACERWGTASRRGHL